MMPRISSVLRVHWPAPLAALIVALLIYAPVIAFPIYAGNAYQGINIPPFGTDEHGYLTRAKETLEGKSMGEPFLAEGKTENVASYSSFERGFLFPLTLFAASKNINVATLYNTLGFVGIFALILLIYAFVYRISSDRWLAVATAVFVVGGYTITETRTLFHSGFNIYGRNPFPWASSLLFFGYALCLYEGLVRERPRALIGAAVLLGISCYAYFYTWTFEFALAGSLILIFLVLRNLIRARNVFLVALGGALIGAPVWISLLSVAHSPVSAEMNFYNWVVSSHVPIFSRIGTVTAILFALYLRFRRDENMPLFGALILAGWVALNEQVITGKVLQYGHYYWYFVTPISIVVGAYLLQKFAPQKFKLVLPVILVVLALVNTVGGQHKAFFAHTSEKLHEQAYAPALTALRQGQPGVVLTAMDDSYPMLVTIYTDRDLYWSASALIYNTPQPRIEESLLVYLFLNKESRSDPVRYLTSHLASGETNPYVTLYKSIEGYRTGFEYYDYEKRLTGGLDPKIAEVRGQLLDQLKADYVRDFSSPVDVSNILEKRDVRYVLWDKTISPEWDIAFLHPKLLVESQGVALYSF